MARMVATKTALSVRIDALSDADTKSAEDAPIKGIESRAKLESRLRMLEQGMGIQSVRRAVTGTSMNKQPGKFEMRSNGASYNPAADVLIPSQPPAANGADDSSMQVDGDVTANGKKSKKDKKRKRDAAAEFDQEASTVEAAAPAEDVSVLDPLDATCLLTPQLQLDKKERKRLKKEAKLAEEASALERKAAAEIGDVSLAATAAGDVTNADESTVNGADGMDEAERKRLKKEKKAAKAAKKAAAA